MDDFTPVQAHAVHLARQHMLEAAKRYKQKMPNSSIAASFDSLAEDLLKVRDMILDRLPEQFHEHRKAYRDYAAPNTSLAPPTRDT